MTLDRINNIILWPLIYGLTCSAVVGAAIGLCGGPM